MKNARRPQLSKEGRNAVTAMRIAVRKLLAESRRTGIPLVIWKNGRIATIGGRPRRRRSRAA